MNAEGIREIARMQSEIDAYSIGIQYILLKLSCPNKEHLFPDLNIPEISYVLDMIKDMQKQSD